MTKKIPLTMTLLPALLFAATLPAQQATEMWQAEGYNHFENLGERIYYVDDLNGDGIRDLLSIAPHANTNSLTDNGSIQARAGNDGHMIWRIDGVRDNELWGERVRTVSDLSGDGINDFIVIEPNWSSHGLVENGRIMVINGQGGGILWVHGGNVSYQHCGESIAIVPDTNNDGIPEICIGAPNASTNGLFNNGFVRMLSGNWGDTLWTVDGDSNGQRYGHDLHCNDDLNGDGISDIVMVSHQAHTLGLIRNGMMEALDSANGNPLWRTQGAASYEALGDRFVDIPDLDADGVPDILVSSPDAFTNGLFWNGWAGAFSGATGAAIWRVDGTQSNEILGQHFSFLKDLDGDGTQDAISGSPNASVGGFIENGELMAISGQTGNILWSTIGTGDYERLGAKLTMLDDITGDGLFDFIASSSDADTNGLVDNGVVMGFDAATGSISWRRDGAASGNHLGDDLIKLDDINADGVSDLIISSPFADGLAPNDGLLLALDSATGATLWQTVGQVEDEALGEKSLNMGDINGDGISDIISFSDHADTKGLSNNGLVKAVSGSTGSVIWRIEGQRNDEYLGAVHRATDDHDGDGFPDLFLGSPHGDSGGMSDNGYMVAISAGMGLHLEVSSLIAGQTGTLSVTDFDAFSHAHFLGSYRGPGPHTQYGLTVALTAPMRLGVAQTDVNGSANWPVAIPATAAGRRLWFQAVQVVGQTTKLTNLSSVLVP